jgi:hypothetical protein
VELRSLTLAAPCADALHTSARAQESSLLPHALAGSPRKVPLCLSCASRNLVIRGSSGGPNLSITLGQNSASNSPVAKELSQIRANQAFQQIEVIRNILAHRTAGGRGSSSHSTRHEDGSFTVESVKEWFYFPGLKKTLPFDELFFEHILNNVGALVNRLAVASVTFIENQTSLATA